VEPTTIALLFKLTDLPKAIAKYVGIVESVDKKLDRLLQSDFNAAVRCLQELSDSKHEREFLLRDAWHRFHTALAHETGDRKALAYLGLAFCQQHLGESDLATSTLRELSEYHYLAPGATVARTAALCAWAGVIGGAAAFPYGAYLAGKGLMSKKIKRRLSAAEDAYLARDDTLLARTREAVTEETVSERNVRLMARAARNLVEQRASEVEIPENKPESERAASEKAFRAWLSKPLW
jgi:hypothetical protein